MLIDTHAHLLSFGNEYQQFGFEKHEIEGVVERARSQGVSKIISPGTNLETSKQSVMVAKKYPGVVYAAVGIHPEEILRITKVPNSGPESSEPIIQRDAKVPNSGPESSEPGVRKSSDLSFATLQTALRSELGVLNDLITQYREQVVAVGEVGTDTNSEELTKRMSEQQELFGSQCELALKHDLPIIVHTRASLAETFAVLDKLPKMPRGQFHCFSYDEAGLSEVLKRGFYVSFCGNITWSKRLKQLVEMVPKDRLLLETDSPFMMPRIATGNKSSDHSPIIAQGSELRDNSGPESSEPKTIGSELTKAESSEPRVRNEPKNVRMLASIQAEMRNETIEEVEKVTSENVMRLYGI